MESPRSATVLLLISIGGKRPVVVALHIICMYQKFGRFVDSFKLEAVSVSDAISDKVGSSDVRYFKYNIKHRSFTVNALFLIKNGVDLFLYPYILQISFEKQLKLLFPGI